jgi:ABC-type transport system substrate-binding protein
VGGGPGSDLAGALTYLIELGYSKFDCTILDFNADMWRTAAGPLAGIVRNEAKKFGRKVDLNVEWRQFDMGASGAEKLLLDGGFQLITCCWALNEMPFNQPMWQAIV